MNHRLLRPGLFSFLVFVLSTLTLGACSSSDDGEIVEPGPPPEPLAVDDLRAISGNPSTITLAWTSPQYADKATIRYDLRHIAYGSEDDDWDSWTVVRAPDSDSGPGQARTYVVSGLSENQVYAFGLKVSTNGVDWTDISNVAVATAAVGFDTTPPGEITRMFLYKSTPTSLTVAWPNAGDDGPHGLATSYEVRYATEVITDASWETATVVTADIVSSSLPGTMETTISDLSTDQEYFAAVKATDDRGHTSDLSNVVSAVTEDKRTFYVNVEGTGDYPTIEAAIDAATVGDLILVGPGRYTWTNQATGDSLRGLVFVDRDYTDFEVRSIAGPEATILDAEHHGRCMAVTGGSWPLPGGGLEYAGITIDGFTFTNGKAVGEEASPVEGWSGAGLNLHLTDTIVRNCIMTGNEARQGGGLWVGGQGDALIEDCVIENNRARFWGGGIMLVNSEPRITVRNTIVRNNHATREGGGIWAGNVACTLENLLIVNNTSSDEGGGLQAVLLNPECEMISCTVADNDGNVGSAIRLTENTTLRIESSLLAFNTGSAAFSTAVQSGIEIGCTLVYGHDQGNHWPSIHTDLGGNLELDPLFCDRTNYLLQADSPCLPGNHPDSSDCGVIGARAGGCSP
jgi:hypothetical protein